MTTIAVGRAIGRLHDVQVPAMVDARRLAADRRLAVQTITLGPHVPDPPTAAAVLRDAVVAHAPLMDRFAKPNMEGAASW